MSNRSILTILVGAIIALSASAGCANLKQGLRQSPQANRVIEGVENVFTETSTEGDFVNRDNSLSMPDGSELKVVGGCDERGLVLVPDGSEFRVVGRCSEEGEVIVAEQIAYNGAGLAAVPDGSGFRPIGGCNEDGDAIVPDGSGFRAIGSCGEEGEAVVPDGSGFKVVEN